MLLQRAVLVAVVLAITVRLLLPVQLIKVLLAVLVAEAEQLMAAVAAVHLKLVLRVLLRQIQVLVVLV